MNCAGNLVIQSAKTSLCVCGLRPSRKNGRGNLCHHSLSLIWAILLDRRILGNAEGT